MMQKDFFLGSRVTDEAIAILVIVPLDEPGKRLHQHIEVTGYGSTRSCRSDATGSRLVVFGTRTHTRTHIGIRSEVVL